jgi:hypothetical protein
LGLKIALIVTLFTTPAQRLAREPLRERTKSIEAMIKSVPVEHLPKTERQLHVLKTQS